MNADVIRWQENSEQYLSAALAWLRLRLEGLAAAELVATPTPTLTPAPATPLEGGTKFFDFLDAEPESSEDADTDAPQPATPLTALEAAETAMNAAAASEPPPTMVSLANRFQLSHFEQQLLLLCAAMELDTRMPALCARAQDDPQRRYPTFALALALFDEPAWAALSPEGPLRYWRLIEINQPPAEPLVTSPLRVDERVVNYLKGLNYLDDRLAPFLVPFDIPAGAADLPPSQQRAVSLATGYLQHPPHQGAPPAVQLLGEDSLSKQLVASQVAGALGLHLYRLPVDLLPVEVTQLETIARLWQRESLLLPVALYVDADDAAETGKPEGQSPPLHRFLAHSQGIFFLATREIRPGLGATAAAVEVDRPAPAEQQVIWREALDGSLDAALQDSPKRLTSQFNLNAVTIRQIVGVAAAEAAANEETLTDKALWAACLMNTRPRLDLLAQRVEPRATWDDIVLTETVSDLLHQVGAQVRHRHLVYDEWGFREKMSRGLGINALFAGESGTGKTMAAEVLADELKLNLYRIDLSAVVSKYIGETEKNLRRLFDAAEDGGAILFFDEADALFGKRSEVKDSHDRYANIEVNYLLQRMEAYRGLAILATNRKSALDQAFMRRLRFIVTFPFPGSELRALIWRSIFPRNTWMLEDGLDAGHLARLNLTGGSIQKVALNAAFLAAEANKPVTMDLILTAARTEYRNLGRPIKEADFRWESDTA